LNLQTCGVLINYDMPWNPMRVEQRIGRIDRIGQTYANVWIRNYFYDETVEARVYKALADRIDWFETVVGQLQPILARVGQVIQTLAMVPQGERQAAFTSELNALRTELEGAKAGLNLDEWVRQADGRPEGQSPITQTDLEHRLITSVSLGRRFRPHETIPGAHWLSNSGREIGVTFHQNCFDAHPSTLQFLTFGNSILDVLLREVPDPAAGAFGGLLRLSADEPVPRVAYYRLDDAGRPMPITGLADLERAAKDAAGRVWSEAAIASVQGVFSTAVDALAQTIQRRREQLRSAERAARIARARRLLLDAASVEIALGQHPTLFDRSPSPMAFDERAVAGLRRHGSPWKALYALAGAHDLRPAPTDPFYVEIQSCTLERLQSLFSGLTQRAGRLLQELAQQR
jgi:hypothetical protein